jgi:DNA-binding beta-propeller fold protein YncE
MSTILKYSFTTTPNPLTVGLADGIFLLLADNNTGNSVSLRGISISIKTGTNEEDLTNNPKQINPVAPSGWKMAEPNISPGKYTFVFIPKSGDSITIPAYGSLIFRLEDINISSDGAAEITITEGSNNEPIKNFSVSKFPSGWGKISFSALPPNQVNSVNVTLSWNGPDKANYHIEYLDNSTQRMITIPAPGDPCLSNSGSYPGPNDPPITINSTTNFTLIVEAIILGQKYFTEISQEVTVGEIPNVLCFDAKIIGNNMNSQLELSWKCSDNAIYAMPSWQAELLSPNSSIKIDLPFEKQYSIKAVASNGIKSTAKSINLNWAVISEIDFNDDNSEPWGITLDTNEKFAYVADQGSHCVRKISLTDFQEVATIPVSSDPRAIAVTPNENLAFIGHYVDSDNVGISVISLPELKVIKTFNITNFTYCEGIAITPDGQYALAVSQGNGSIIIIEISSMKLINTVKLDEDASPSYITISPEGQRAYISNTNGTFVTVFDIKEQKVISNINYNFSYALQVTPDGKYVIASSLIMGNVSKIDSTSLKTVPPSLTLNSGPTAIAISADSSTAIVCSILGMAYFINITSFNKVTETIKIKGYPYGIVMTKTDFALITNFNDGSIQVLALHSISPN